MSSVMAPITTAFSAPARRVPSAVNTEAGMGNRADIRRPFPIIVFLSLSREIIRKELERPFFNQRRGRFGLAEGFKPH